MKFSAVLGTTSPNNPITIRPALLPPIVISKKHFLVTLGPSSANAAAANTLKITQNFTENIFKYLPLESTSEVHKYSEKKRQEIADHVQYEILKHAWTNHNAVFTSQRHVVGPVDIAPTINSVSIAT